MDRLISFLDRLSSSTKKVNFIFFATLFLVTLVLVLDQSPHPYNNFFIYKNVYKNTILERNLYALYPEAHFDRNHYGILFSLIIAPFYYLPPFMGVMLYCMLQVVGIFWTVRHLPFTIKQQNVMLLFLLFELIANIQNVQTNTFVAITILLSYILIKSNKNFLASFWIVFGMFIKLYSILGAGLFFLARNKLKYLLGFILFSIFLFFAPLLITSQNFLFQSYIDWYHELTSKNSSNLDINNLYQSISFIGIVVKVLRDPEFPVVWLMIGGIIFQLSVIIKSAFVSDFKKEILLTSSLLLFIILFNTGTEASTHIIGATGFVMWWVIQPNRRSIKMLCFVFACFWLGTLSTTDLTPRFVNYEIIRKYSLKALPYFLVWCLCVYQILSEPKIIDDHEQAD